MITLRHAIMALALTALAPAALADGPYVIGAGGAGPVHRAASTDADALKGSLCTGEDWVVFSGTSQTNGKIVSICVNEGDDEIPPHVTYRFGRPGAVELVHPDADTPSKGVFTLRVYTRPQTTYLKFHFQAGGFDFAILEGYDHGETDATLRVTRLSDGQVVARHNLTLLTEPLTLMGLDMLVRTAEFDE